MASAITYATIAAAFRRMTSEGGMFYKSAERQATTLWGIFGTLKDAIYFTADEMGNLVINTFDLKPKMIAATKALEQMQIKLSKFVQENPKLSKFLILLVAAITIIPPFLFLLGVLASLFKYVALGVKVLAVALRLLFLTPIGLAITAVAALVVGMIYLYNKSETFRNVINSIAEAFSFWPKVINKAIDSLKRLADILKPFYDRAKSNLINITDNISGVASSAVGGVSTIEKASAVNNKSSANVNININDKNNNVKSFDVKKRGYLEMAVGKNMGHV